MLPSSSSSPSISALRSSTNVSFSPDVSFFRASSIALFSSVPASPSFITPETYGAAGVTVGESSCDTGVSKAGMASSFSYIKSSASLAEELRISAATNGNLSE